MASNREGRELFRALSRGERPAPICLIYGEEAFLVGEAVKAVVRAVVPEGGDDTSHEVFEGGECSGQAIRQALENLSLFGGRRLVRVRNVAAMSPEDLAALAPYLDRPAPDTTLLLTDRAVDMRRSFFKAVKACKRATVVQYRSLYPNELPQWVERRARQKGLVGVSEGLEGLIVELTGPDLAAMDSALEKLSLHTGGAGGAVSEELIRSVLDDTRVRTVFELTRQLGERDLAAGLSSLARLLDKGESAVGVVAMIARHFRIVWRVRTGLDQGIRGRDLASHAGCPPMFVGEYERDARRFPPDRLGEIVRLIHDTERTLKSSALRDSLVVGNLVMEICRPSQHPELRRQK